MSKKLSDLIKQKKQAGQKLLSIFVTAGFPERDATVDIITSLAENGADFIELGMPFSDPIADGPVIQKASDVALNNGIILQDIFNILKEVRKTSDIPILLMGYFNPVFHYGIESFLRDASIAGADGLIIPDWPLEENIKYQPLLKELDLDLVQLVAPNTPLARIKQIDEISNSFIYCVAYTGVTGQDSQLSNETKSFLNHLKQNLICPWLVGFGVRQFEDVQRYCKYADGVIVGTVFIQLLEKTDKEKRKEAIKKFMISLQGK